MVDFMDTPDQAAFRARVRDFIEDTAAVAERPGEDPLMEPAGSDASEHASQRWRKALAERGWLGPHWPVEYGGLGLTVTEQFILNQELAERIGTVSGLLGIAVMMFGPTLILTGSEEQKQQHLPKILADEFEWCQGWSEPGAGSDLASLQTRAKREGDDFVISGQKIWTSRAHKADGMYFIARTDPDAPKHRGISFFWMNMDLPGISVRPLVNMADRHSFNEVFFEDVRIPAANMIGEENRGWYAAATLLDFERSGIGNSIGASRQVSRIVDLANELPEEQTRIAERPMLRANFADRAVDAEVGMLFSFRIMTMQAQGLVPNMEASVAKLFNSEMAQRIAQLHMSLLGLYGNLWDEHREEGQHGAAAQRYLQAVSSTIGGGTSEIQRNIIATRGLALPRG